MRITRDQVLVRNSGIAAADLEGQVVILDIRAGAYLALNGVASEIWNLLSEPYRVADLFSDLAKSHDVDDATLARDVLPFLEQMLEKQLLRPSPGDTP